MFLLGDDVECQGNDAQYGRRSHTARWHYLGDTESTQRARRFTA